MSSNDLTLTIASLSGQMRVLGSVKNDIDLLAYKISALQSKTNLDMTDATQQLQGMVGYRAVSTIDDASFNERQEGKSGVVDFIQAHPECTQTEALEAWQGAALASRPEDQKWLLHGDADGLLKQYAYNVCKLGLIPEATWENFRAVIVGTPKAQIMSM